VCHTISGTTSCIPLIGHPVAQVRTPQPINRHFADRDIDAIMFPFDLAPSRVADFFNTVRGWENCRGVSVTYPHKQAAFAQVDAATERARRVGAVNTIRRESDGRLLGEMTDGLAFVAALRATGAAIEGCRFLLVGAGGAGAAIAQAVAEANAATIVVNDIDRMRQQALIGSLRIHHPGVEVHDWLPAGLAVDIAANASTLGMGAGDAHPFDLDRLPSHAIVADAVTMPDVTPWIAQARERGHRVQTGIQMALAQLTVQLGFLGYPVDAAAGASTLTAAKG
jgi:shikimate dehydrogenase